jgi:hypothetical protein
VHVSAKISFTDRIGHHFYVAKQRVNEGVTLLSHERTTFILGGKDIMEPDQTFKWFLTSVTEVAEKA